MYMYILILSNKKCLLVGDSLLFQGKSELLYYYLCNIKLFLMPKIRKLV